MKRALSVFLSLLMLCTAPGMTAFAEDASNLSKKDTGNSTTEVVVETNEAVDVAEEAVVDVAADAAEEVVVDETAAEVEAAQTEAPAEVAYDEDGKALGTYIVTAAAELGSYPLGATVVINTAVVGAEGQVSYKWQKSLDGQTWGGTSLGGNSQVLSFTATEARLQYYYRLVVFADNGKVYSNPVKVELAPSPTISVSNLDAVPLGAKVVITATPNGFTGAVSYQWQRSADQQSWTNTSLSGNKSTELSFTATESRLSYYYRLVVKDQFGRYESAAVKVAEAETPVVTVAANETEVALQDQVIIKVTSMTGLDNYGEVSYQWQKSNDGENWSNTSLRGYNTDKLNFYATESRLEYSYRVRVKNSIGTWYSNAVKVELKEAEAVVTTPVVSMYCSAQTCSAIQPENGEIINYDFGTYGSLVTFIEADGVKDNTVSLTMYALDEEPDFTIDQIDDAKAVIYDNDDISLTTTNTMYPSIASLGRYLRIKVVAQDVNYEQNGATETLEFAIRCARHVAVFICNGDYAGTINDLAGPPVDCAQMVGTLEQLDQAWEIYAYNDVDADDMVDAMNTHFADTTENDICLFYYSGHGASNGSLCGVNNTYLSTTQLANSLNAATKGKVIVLLDSCYSGAHIGVAASDPIHHIDPTAKPVSDYRAAAESVIDAFKGLNATITRNNSMAKAGELCVENKFYVITACGNDQTSWDYSYDGFRAGYFTVHLLLGLGCHYPDATFDEEMPGDVDGDWCLSLGEAFNYTTELIEEENYPDIYAHFEAYHDEIIAEWYELAEEYGEAFTSEYPTPQDWFDAYIEYQLSQVQVTCAYGDANFIMFRRYHYVEPK